MLVRKRLRPILTTAPGSQVDIRAPAPRKASSVQANACTELAQVFEDDGTTLLAELNCGESYNCPPAGAGCVPNITGMGFWDFTDFNLSSLTKTLLNDGSGYPSEAFTALLGFRGTRCPGCVFTIAENFAQAGTGLVMEEINSGDTLAIALPYELPVFSNKVAPGVYTYSGSATCGALSFGPFVATYTIVDPSGGS